MRLFIFLIFLSLIDSSISHSTTPHKFKSVIKNDINSKRDKDSFNFLLIGDWGWNSYNQSLTAYEMGVYAWLISAEFVIALGDNFYNDGVASISDSLWDTAFHDVYTSKYLQIPWFPVMGNHDYHGNVTAQVARTKVDQGIWTMPEDYYSYVYDIPGGGTLCIVYVDTCLIDPYEHDTSTFLNNPNWEQLRQDHLDWIEKTLAEQNQTATWLIVAGHYPVYSVGDSGDNEYLIELLLPIMKRSNVHAYICGHDHNHQHIYKDGFHFIVDGSGGGRGPLGPNGLRHLGISAASNNMKNYFVNCGFSFVEVTTDTLKISFVTNSGHVKYTTLFDNPLHPPQNYLKSMSSMSFIFAAHPGISILIVLVVIAIPVMIVGVYSFYYLQESKHSHLANIALRDTAIDVSTRSVTPLFKKGSGSGSNF